METGSQTSVPALLAAVDELGLAAADLARVVVTHIHLDHAGGVGDVAVAFLEATVYVHERGPATWWTRPSWCDSAAMVYGDLLDTLYGRLTPTPAARVHVLADGEEMDVGGGRVVTTIDSPGHAKHHLALHDSESGVLFAGDAVGIRLPDAGDAPPGDPAAGLRPRPGPLLDRRFADRRPTGMALADYGLVPEAEAMLAEADRDPHPLGRGGRDGPPGGRGHRRGA